MATEMVDIKKELDIVVQRTNSIVRGVEYTVRHQTENVLCGLVALGIVTFLFTFIFFGIANTNIDWTIKTQGTANFNALEKYARNITESQQVTSKQLQHLETELNYLKNQLDWIAAMVAAGFILVVCQQFVSLARK